MREILAPASTCAADEVELRLLYDVFAPSTVEIHELVHQTGQPLATYLDGLPAECEWMVFVNGREVDLADAKTVAIDAGDVIGLLLVPQGGDGLKSILRMVVTIAAVVASLVFLAPIIGIPGALAVGMAVAGVINALLLTPKPKTPADQNNNSYGIDGAKNSATENIPYQVVYGEFRTGGNFADTYTENVGDDQYLYLRAVLNDGEIEGVYDLELNEQPISNFTDVQTILKKGTLTEDVNPWFGRSLRQVNKSVKIDTADVIHQTTTPVDHVRFDVSFTTGLVNVDKKKGTYSTRSVTFVMEYRELDPVTKQPVSGWTGASGNPSNYQNSNWFNNPLINGLLMKVWASKGYQQSAALETGAEARYRIDGGEWISMSPTIADPGAYGYNFDPSGDGSVVGQTDISPVGGDYYEIQNPGGGDVNIDIPGATITQVVVYPHNQTGQITVQDSRTRAIRKSFESGPLNLAYHEVRIRRTTATSTDQYKVDEVYLTDVAEIQTEQVALRGTANLSLRIKLSEQLNQIPTVTARTRGCILQEYDVEGNKTVKRWSANPAWICLDILCGEQRGCGFPLDQIDWPAWVDFAQYCVDKGITFNGVFAESSNVGDALATVLRVAYAAPVPLGRRLSVAIDRPRDPVTMFGAGNIHKGTFQVTYMGMTDRANEFELSFYDKNDRNKEKTIRYVDPKAVLFNEAKRTAALELPGVDNIAQATAQLWRFIYANRVLIRSIDFETGLESINLTIGENALISHPMMEWSQSGRTAFGSTTTRVQLDQEVNLIPGKQYALMVHFDTTAAGTAVISNVVGNRILLPTNASLSTAAPPMRVTCGTADAEVVDLVKGGTYDTILLDSTVGFTVGAQVAFWDTDAVIECPVVAPAAEVTQTFVDVSTPLPGAPDALRNFIFGEVTDTPRIYTLIGIEGTGIEKRKLSFGEYNELVYGPPEVEIPTPVTSLSDRAVGHVQTVLFDYERLVEANRKSISARVHWSAAGIRNYAGADVYMGVNGGPLRPIGSAVNVAEYMVTANPGDVVEFRVCAYNKHGDRAPLPTAPGVRGTISVTYSDLDPPEEIAVVPKNFQVDGTADVVISPPADATGVTGYEVQYRKSTAADWSSLGVHSSLLVTITGLETGGWVAQVRSVSETSESPWVQKSFDIAIAPGSIMADFLSQNNRNGAAIPAPTTEVGTDVDHTVNTDGSADISFEWGWTGDEASIDGFEVMVTSSAT
jgi:hypothetical protein